MVDAEEPKGLIKTVKEKVSSIFEKFKTAEYAFMIVIAIIIGILGGLGAALLRVLIRFFQKQFWGVGGHDLLAFFLRVEWWKKLIIPAAGAFVVGLIVYYLSRESKGHGVPEVMEAISLRNGIIRPRVVSAKLVASSITIASGGSVGREGPIIQIGSAIGSSIGQLLRLSRNRMRTLVGCGAAAGIAAAFNAPIAGALFSVEIILGDFAVSQFSPIVISSVTATVITRVFYGNYPAFIVPKYELVHPFELVPYMILGVVAGGVAILFIKVLYFLEDRFDNIKAPDFYKTTMGGLCIGMIGIFFPQIFGVGYTTIDLALNGKMAIWMLFVLVFVKILATSITLGSGSSGGIFAPSLFLGAMTGGFFGTILHRLFPTVTAGPGAYALVAMSAVVAATTHAPITAILIIFEMTSDYKIILPLMIATIISGLLSTRLQTGSIYTLKLMRRGINIHAGKEINVLKSMKVKDVMQQSIEIVPRDASIKEVMNKFVQSKHSYFYITDDRGIITERISQSELSAIAPDYDNIRDFVVAIDIASPNLILVKDDDNLDDVMREFEKENVDEIPVVSSDNPGRVLGTVWRVDVIAAYNKEVLKRDLAGEVSTLITKISSKKMVEIMNDVYLIEIEAPKRFIGKTIKEIDIRNRYKVDVILVKKRVNVKTGHEEIVKKVPDARYRISSDDVLLVLGEKKWVEKLNNL